MIIEWTLYQDTVSWTQEGDTITINVITAESLSSSHIHTQTASETIADTDHIIGNDSGGTLKRWLWTTLKTALQSVFALASHAEEHDPDGSDPITVVHGNTSGRDAADAHPATSISFSGTASGLSVTQMQAAIDAALVPGTQAVGTVSGTATITPALGDYKTLFLTATFEAAAEVTFAAPTGLESGDVLILQLTNMGLIATQTWASVYPYSVDDPPAWSSDKMDQIAMIYDGAKLRESIIGATA